MEEQPNKPHIDVSGLRDITVKAGQDFSIHVPYRGFPRPTAAWTRDDQAVDDSDSRVHTQLGDDLSRRRSERDHSSRQSGTGRKN